MSTTGDDSSTKPRRFSSILAGLRGPVWWVVLALYLGVSVLAFRGTISWGWATLILGVIAIAYYLLQVIQLIQLRRRK